MTERSMLWDDGNGDGGPYTEARTRDMLKVLAGNPGADQGVLFGMDDQLAVSSPGANTIRAATGWALVDGTIYQSTAQEDVAVASPSGGTTGGLVVLRKSWSAQTVRIAVKTNTDGNSSIPSATQSDGVTWEIPLASFTIATDGSIASLIDLRDYVFPAGGLVGWGVITGSSGALAGAQGITSVSRTGTGTYEITFARPVNAVHVTLTGGVAAVVVLGTGNSGGVAATPFVGGIADLGTSTVTVTVLRQSSGSNTAATAPADPLTLHVAGYA